MNQLAALEAEVLRAVQAGQDERAGQLWQRILEMAPEHPKALLALSQRAFRRQDLAHARALLERLVAVDGRDPQQWINLAVVCQGLKDEAAEADALSGALKRDPYHLLALILRGNLLERQGKQHAAASAYGAAARVAPPLSQLHPNLRPALEKALAFREQYDRDFSAFLSDYLAPHAAAAGGNLGRFNDSIDIMFGRKRRYESQSALYHYPGLAPVSFYERQDFHWLDAVEAATAAIREEYLAVLAADTGFEAYLQYGDDMPLNQWAELNKSLNWSAFHLIQDGRRVDANADRCPRTMAALAGAPQPQQPGRTPSAMFSLLKPHTHIPPHSGVSNSRLVVHLPLIVPGQCAFRVGNDTREWEVGKAWVFDDTIEHEAWNRSQQPRTILMFDVWHPALSEAERTMISALSAGMQAYSQSEGFGL